MSKRTDVKYNIIHKFRKKPLSVQKETQADFSQAISIIGILLKTYDYNGILSVIKEQPELFPDDAILKKIVYHAQSRVSSGYWQAQNVIREEEFLGLVEPYEYELRPFIEAYHTLEVKLKKRELADFIGRLTPFFTHLAEYYLNGFIDLNLLSYSEYNGSRKVNREIVLRFDKSLLRFLDSQYGGRMENGFLKFRTLFYMLKYLPVIASKKGMRNFNHLEWESIMNIFSRFERLELMVRNPLVHNLTGAGEEDIKKAWNGDSRKVLDDCRQLLILIFGVENQSISCNIYDEINREIMRRMEVV